MKFDALCASFTAIVCVNGANVAITNRNVAIVVGEGLPGIITRLLPDGVENVFELPFPPVIGPVTDVTLDIDNHQVLFALGKVMRDTDSALEDGLCAFRITNKQTLQLASCAIDILVEPFSKIAAKGGNVTLSGGDGGFSVYSYNEESGTIIENLHKEIKLDNVLSHPSALMLNSTFVALATQFADFGFGGTQYGTMIVDLSGVPQEVQNFRIQNSIGLQYAISPSNFCLQSALYTSVSGTQIMYTANGVLTVQDPNRVGTTREISFEGFSAFIIAVNQENNILALGGVDDFGMFRINFYNIENPVDPQKYYEVFGLARLTSLATYKDFVLYSTTAGDESSGRQTFYSFFDLPEIPPAPAPVALTDSPTVSQTPSVSSAPTFPAPTSTPTVSLSPTSTPESSSTSTVRMKVCIFISLVSCLHHIMTM